MTKQEAEAAGFIVDTTCYPWLAYKGPRFRTTECASVLTDLEAALLAALQEIENVHRWSSLPIDSEGANMAAQTILEIDRICRAAIDKAA